MLRASEVEACLGACLHRFSHVKLDFGVDTYGDLDDDDWVDGGYDIDSALQVCALCACASHACVRMLPATALCMHCAARDTHSAAAMSHDQTHADRASCVSWSCA